MNPNEQKKSNHQILKKKKNIINQSHIDNCIICILIVKISIRNQFFFYLIQKLTDTLKLKIGLKTYFRTAAASFSCGRKPFP